MLSVWTGFIWLSIGPHGGLCAHGNKHSGAIKLVNFLPR
jgi:hypothetical protein